MRIPVWITHTHYNDLTYCLHFRFLPLPAERRESYQFHLEPNRYDYKHCNWLQGIVKWAMNNFKAVYEELCIEKDLQDDFLRVCDNRYVVCNYRVSQQVLDSPTEQGWGDDWW